MVDQKVIDYVNNGLQRGYKPNALKSALIQQGWPEADIDQALQMARGQAKATPQAPGMPTTNMGIFQKMKMILTNPNGFFQAAKSDHIGDALKYYAVVLLIPTIVMIAIGMFLPTALLTAMAPTAGGDMAAMGGMFAGLFSMLAVGMGVAFYFLSLIGTFITAGIYHIIGMLFGARNPYSETYKALTYSMTPFVLIGWVAIPLAIVHVFAYMGAAIAIGLWALIIAIKGFSIMQDMETKKAAVVILLPAIIVGVLAVLTLLMGASSMLAGGMVPSA